MVYWKRRGDKVPLRQGGSSGSGLFGSGDDVMVDQSYSSTSPNAQSGKAVSQAVTAASSRISAKIGGALHFKGEVQNFSDLPGTSEIGDFYNVKATDANYIWDGKQWDKLSESLDNLATQTQVTALNTQLTNHKNNSDTDVHHVTATELNNFTQSAKLTKSDIDSMFTITINARITKGDITTEEYWTSHVTQYKKQIQDAVLQAANAQITQDALSTATFALFKTEIENKLKRFIKSEKGHKLKIYLEGDVVPELASRDPDTIYMIARGGDIEGGKLELNIATTSASQQVDLGYYLGTASSNSEVTGGIINWGDGSARTVFSNGEGQTSSKFKHTYATAKDYKITINGKVAWGNLTNTTGPTNDQKAFGALVKSIVIPAGCTSPIYALGSNAFIGFNKITAVPNGLFDSCLQSTALNGCFSGCTLLTTVPEKLFDHCGTATSFTNGFLGCRSLTTIPANIFKAFTKVTSFWGCFSGCSGLTAIPEALFSTCAAANTFSYCFEQCQAIKQIPAGLFSRNTNARDFVQTFEDNTGITTIPANLFSTVANTNTTNFTECFKGCTGINTDLLLLWNSHSNATHTNCYDGCTKATNYLVAQYKGWASGAPEAMELKITTTAANETVDLGYCIGKTTTSTDVTGGYILWGDGTADTKFGKGDGEPNAKFKHQYIAVGDHTITIIGKIFWGHGVNQLATNDIRNTLKTISIPSGHTSPIYDLGTYAFYNATKLTSIPATLFDHCTKVTSFYFCFYYCTSLASIPAHLFDKCIAATNFDQTFCMCTSLASIPNNLFDYNTKVTTFRGCFFKTAITAIPELLFAKNTAVTNFVYTFLSCTKLKTIPTKLFATNTRATTFSQCFQNCTSLTTIPDTLFSTNTAVTDFSKVFYVCKGLTIVPASLFNTCKSVTTFANAFENCTAIKSAVPTLWTTHSTATGTDCFKGCTQATNWPDVPEDWGGEPKFGETVDFIIDQTESDPEKMITYCGNKMVNGLYPRYTSLKPMRMVYDATTHKGTLNWGSWTDDHWLLQKFKPCILNTDGTVDTFLNRNNLMQKEDGTWFTGHGNGLAGDYCHDVSGKNQMIQIGQIWIKEEWTTKDFGTGLPSVSTDVIHISLAPRKIDDTYTCWSHYDIDNKLQDYCYKAMYKGLVDNTSISTPVVRSISNSNWNDTKFTTCFGMPGHQARIRCQANGKHWDCNYWSLHRLLTYVCIALAKTTNVQEAFGSGMCNLSADLSNGDDHKHAHFGTVGAGMFSGYNDGKHHVTVLGIEDIWSNSYDLVLGLAFANHSVYYKMTPNTADGTTGASYDSTLSNYKQYELKKLNDTYYPDVAQGYVTKLTLYTGHGLFPSETSTSTGDSKLHYCAQTLKIQFSRVGIYGGMYIGGSYTGGDKYNLFSFYPVDSVGNLVSLQASVSLTYV